MKKSVKIRAFALIAASMFLCGALTVAAVMGSPYEILKKATLDALTYRNATMEFYAEAIFDGETCAKEKSLITIGENGYLACNFDENGEPNGDFYYSSGNLSVCRAYLGEDGTQWYSAYISPRELSENSSFYRTGNSFPMFSPEDRDSARLRFMELLVDIFVGDLKNNITMSSDGGVRLIQGTLTESQIPDIVKAGIDMFVEESQAWYDSSAVTREDYAAAQYPFDIPVKGLAINLVHGEAEIDEKGNMLSFEVSGNLTYVNIFGDVTAVELCCGAKFSEIGTSEAACPIPGANQLLDGDYMKAHFGSAYGNVYFALNEDGSINATSVTTTYPGESDRKDYEKDFED